MAREQLLDHVHSLMVRCKRQIAEYEMMGDKVMAAITNLQLATLQEALEVPQPQGRIVCQ